MAARPSLSLSLSLLVRARQEAGRAGGRTGEQTFAPRTESYFEEVREGKGPPPPPQPTFDRKTIDFVRGGREEVGVVEEYIATAKERFKKRRNNYQVRNSTKRSSEGHIIGTVHTVTCHLSVLP